MSSFCGEVQDDHSGCSQPPINTKNRSSVLVWGPCTKTQHLLWCQREVCHNLNGHPVLMEYFRLGIFHAKFALPVRHCWRRLGVRACGPGRISRWSWPPSLWSRSPPRAGPRRSATFNVTKLDQLSRLMIDDQLIRSLCHQNYQSLWSLKVCLSDHSNLKI